MNGGRWLGKAAVLWAMDEAPGVPPHLLAALLAVARYADEDGRGAHPSALTVAAIIRKTERNAKKDLAELRERGLLLSGDQRIVKDIRADKRPFVYDLPMPRGDACDTPSSGNGVSQATGRGVAQMSSGVSHTTPKEILKRSRTARASRARAGSARAGARKPKAGRDCHRCGAPLVLAEGENEHGEPELSLTCKGCYDDPDACDCTVAKLCAFCRSADHEHCTRGRGNSDCKCSCTTGLCAPCDGGNHDGCTGRSFWSYPGCTGTPCECAHRHSLLDTDREYYDHCQACPACEWTGPPPEAARR